MEDLSSFNKPQRASLFSVDLFDNIRENRQLISGLNIAHHYIFALDADKRLLI